MLRNERKICVVHRGHLVRNATTRCAKSTSEAATLSRPPKESPMAAARSDVNQRVNKWVVKTTDGDRRWLISSAPNRAAERKTQKQTGGERERQRGGGERKVWAPTTLLFLTSVPFCRFQHHRAMDEKTTRQMCSAGRFYHSWKDANNISHMLKIHFYDFPPSRSVIADWFGFFVMSFGAVGEEWRSHRRRRVAHYSYSPPRSPKTFCSVPCV